MHTHGNEFMEFMEVCSFTYSCN